MSRPTSNVGENNDEAISVFTSIGDVENDPYIKKEEIYGEPSAPDDYQARGDGPKKNKTDSGSGGAPINKEEYKETGSSGGSGKSGGNQNGILSGSSAQSLTEEYVDLPQGPQSQMSMEEGVREILYRGTPKRRLYVGETPPKNNPTRRLLYDDAVSSDKLTRKQADAIHKRNDALERMKAGNGGQEEWDQIHNNGVDDQITAPVKPKISEVSVNNQTSEYLEQVALAALEPETIDRDTIEVLVLDLLGSSYNRLDTDLQNKLLNKIEDYVRQTDHARRVLIGGIREDYKGKVSGHAMRLAMALAGGQTAYEIQETAIEVSAISYIIDIVIEAKIKTPLKPLLSRISDVNLARDLLTDNVIKAAQRSNMDGLETLVDYLGAHSLRSRVEKIASTIFTYYSIEPTLSYKQQAHQIHRILERIDNEWQTTTSYSTTVFKLGLYQAMSPDARLVMSSDERSCVSAMVSETYGMIDAHQMIDQMYLSI